MRQQLLLGVEHLFSGGELCSLADDDKALFKPRFEWESASIVKVTADVPFAWVWWTGEREHWRSHAVLSSEWEVHPDEQKQLTPSAEWLVTKYAPHMRDQWNKLQLAVPDRMSRVVAQAIMNKWGREAASVFHDVKWHGDYWGVERDGMFYGIEPDGYIHT